MDQTQRAALPNASNFTATQFINYLNNGQAGTFANQLVSNSQNTQAYFCALVGTNFAPCKNNANISGAGAHYLINFFQANPYAAGSTTSYMTDAGYSDYNALQIDLREATWHALQADVNYTWSFTLGLATNNNDYQAAPTASPRYVTRTRGMARRCSNIRQVTNVYGTYDLPFGKNRAFLNNSALLNEIVGGFTLGTVITYKTGSSFLLTGGFATFNTGDGGVALNGTTTGALQSAVGVHHVAGHHLACPRSEVLLERSGRRNRKLLAGGAEHDCRNNRKHHLPARPNSFAQNLALSKLIPIRNGMR